mmetsp:Transcript_105025/g.328488  ORF Transcript_105025/g.328488 Transcript_105025/m.328488 type:complete len:88 (+) Transcript_105025:122-385(+)
MASPWRVLGAPMASVSEFIGQFFYPARPPSFVLDLPTIQVCSNEGRPEAAAQCSAATPVRSAPDVQMLLSIVPQAWRRHQSTPARLA